MEFIYINKNSLSKELCEDIIEYFNIDYLKGYKGSTRDGIKIDVKDTWDLNIGTLAKNDKKWTKIFELLSKELDINVRSYIEKINNENLNIEKINNENLNNEKIQYQMLNGSILKPECFQVQKYNKNVGKYSYHIDEAFDNIQNRYRVVTYIWYLNDLVEGGETEFLSKIKIIPETGKLVLFPSGWTYPHCAKVPKSDDKYIITGWIYLYQ